MVRGAIVLALTLVASQALAAPTPFRYEPPGTLLPGSGRGRADNTVYEPAMRFPIEEAPAYPGSQVYGYGGSKGPGGTSCDARNYSYPWRDNYCESRTWDMPLCPSGAGHQGQDIRAKDCKNDANWVVAADDATVTAIGSYTVTLTKANGNGFRYHHMSSLQIKVGDKVRKGQRIGKVSNVFNGTPTSIHVHFDVRQSVTGVGMVWAPPYMSLVKSYERLLGPTPPTEPDAGSTPVVPKPDPGGPPPGIDTSGAATDEGLLEEPPKEEEGCSASTGGSTQPWPWLAALGFLVVRRVRRRGVA